MSSVRPARTHRGIKQPGGSVDINSVPQPWRAQPADFLAAAVHNASRSALVMAVVAVAVVGVDTAVAVHRTAGSTSPLPAAAPPSTSGVAMPLDGIGASPQAQQPLPRAEAKTENHEAKALLEAALANARAKGSVHAVAHFVNQGGNAIFDNHDGRNHGVQRLTIYGGHVTIRVLGPITYYTGDKRGLIKYFGYKPKLAAVESHKWVPLIAGNKGYRILTEGVTLASLLHNQRLAAPLRTLPERTIGGIPVVGVQGRAAGDGLPKHSTATWWVSTGAHPLPVEFDAVSANTRLTQRFSDWGKPVRVKRPHAIF
jgi:hypothetical protein